MVSPSNCVRIQFYKRLSDKMRNDKNGGIDGWMEPLMKDVAIKFSAIS